MINLFKNYSEGSIDLEKSLKAAGYKNKTVVLEDDGYLPEKIITPIKFFTEMKMGKCGIPKFFNEIDVPKHWEIQGNNLHAEIFDGYKKKGKINYSTREKDFRAVRSVEWLNDQERVRSVDLYNQHGVLYGRKTYSDGELTLTTYLNTEKVEVILFNHITNTIQVNYQGKNHLFVKYNDFILFFFKVSKLDISEIFYNDLGTPLFITIDLMRKNPEVQYKHTLFWQEKSTTIPVNMKYLLENNTGTQSVIIQNKNEYHRIKKQTTDVHTSVSIDYLGYIYSLKEKHKVSKSIFILTASDNIAHLQELVEGLPQYEFFIAARTTMSSRLLAFENFSNVHLYPVIDDKTVEFLLDKCSLYLDINYGNEVDQVVRKAFEYSQVIIGFQETIHNRRFIDENNIFKLNQVAELMNEISEITKNTKTYRQAIKNQLQFIGQATAKEYKETLG